MVEKEVRTGVCEFTHTVIGSQNVPAFRDIFSSDGIVGSLVLRHLYNCLERKERTEGRGFCRHSGGNSSSVLADVSVRSSSLWRAVLLFRFQDISRHEGFLMLSVELIFCLSGSHLYLSVKSKYDLSLNQTETSS